MRKAWRVDLKWIFGIIFTVSVFASLCAYFMLGLSSAPGNALSEEALPGSTVPFPSSPISEVFEKAKSNPDALIEVPVIGRLDIRGSDIAGLSQEEIALVFEKAIAKKTKDMTPEETNRMIDKLSKEIPVENYARQIEEDPSGAFLQIYKNYSGVSGFLPFGGVIYEGAVKSIMGFGSFFAFLGLAGLLGTGYRGGKLIGPGVGLSLASFPGLIGFTIGKAYAGMSAGAPAPEGLPVSYLLSALAQKGSVFAISFGVGIFLVFVGLIVSFIIKLARPKTAPIQATAEPAAEATSAKSATVKKDKPAAKKKPSAKSKK